MMAQRQQQKQPQGRQQQQKQQQQPCSIVGLRGGPKDIRWIPYDRWGLLGARWAPKRPRRPSYELDGTLYDQLGALKTIEAS